MKNKKIRFIACVMCILLALSALSVGAYAEEQNKYTLTNVSRLYNPNSGEHFFTIDPNERDYLTSLGWNYEGEAWQGAMPIDSNAELEVNPVYRLYNENGGEHFFTVDVNEKNHLVSVGWKYEGVAFYSGDELTPGVVVTTVSVAEGEEFHLPTTAAEWEKFFDDMINGNLFDRVVIREETVEPVNPIYRLYNPNAFSNNHLFTTDKGERDYLVSIGWLYEGTAWYGF